MPDDDLQALLDALHVATVRELLTRVQAGEATPSELATAVSYLRATKRPEKQGEATTDDQIATAMADLQAGRERARARREALERRQGGDELAD
jgi:vacuolar-type H+-ATPase subunit E/Vma4